MAKRTFLLFLFSLYSADFAAAAEDVSRYAPFDYIGGRHATFESAVNRMRELAGVYGPHLEPASPDTFPRWEASSRRWKYVFRPGPREPETGVTWYRAGIGCEFEECLSEKSALDKFFDYRRRRYCVRNVQAQSDWRGPYLVSGTLFPMLHIGYDKRYAYQLAWRKHNGTCSDYWQNRVHDVFRYKSIACPAGYEIRRVGGGFGCRPERARKHVIYAKPFRGNCNTACQGNPVDLARGTKRYAETLYAADWVTLRLHYNSKANFGESLLYGANWLDGFASRLMLSDHGSSVVAVRRPDGSFLPVRYSVWDGHVVQASDDFGLARTDGGWRLRKPGGEVEVYDGAGYLARLERPGRPDLHFTRDGGRLIRVEDDYGRTLELMRRSSGRLEKLKDPAGREVVFEYDGPGRLSAIHYPDGATKRFLYAGDELLAPLTGIVDGNGERFATYAYDNRGRVILSEHAGGAERIEIDYSGDGGVTVTEAGGNTITYGFGKTPQGWLPTSADGPCATACGFGHRSAAYDGDRRTVRTVDFNGNVTRYERDDRGRVVRRIEAEGTPRERTIETRWHPDYRLPVRIDEPGRRTEFTYNGDGNRLSRTVTDTATGESRTTAWSYNANGLTASVDSPRTDVADVTSYDYDDRGNLVTVTDALGHVTRITEHDAHGNPLRIVDPNGVETLLAYGARQRLVSRSVGGATMEFSYDGAGQLVEVALPGGAVLHYEYDAAHRLTALEDDEGNRIEYTLDALGNRTRQAIRDAGGNLRYAQERVFDRLGRLREIFGNNGQSTAYDYDANGNRTSVTEAGLFSTLRQFDVLDRLVKTSDADNGETTFEYDALGNLVSVTDPEGLTTTYRYNAFGDLVERDSPDTGVTTYAYDEAGNRISRTDARGVTVTYRYDALNRPTLVDYPGDDVDTIYHYDGDNYAASRPNAVGQLTGTQKSGAATTYAYDTRGNLVEERRRIDGVEYMTTYRYDDNDRIVEIGYPSGRTVFYERDPQGRITRVTATHDGGIATLAQAVDYLPFGPSRGMTLGNGQTVTLAYDEDYRLIRKQVPELIDWRWEYDARDNVTAITDAREAGRGQMFGYDALSRLIEAEGSYGMIAYNYDAVGNRLARTADGWTETYRYAGDSHRLQSVTASSGITAYDYDAAGNTTARGSTRYSYDPAGRLRRITRNGTPLAVDQRYDPQGRRFARTLPDESRTELYHYDRQGKLIAETTEAGNVLREYVYLNGKPLALFSRRISRAEKAVEGKPVPQHAKNRIRQARARQLPVEIFYIHTDHLGTPKLLTDTNGETAWHGNYQPFGNVTVTTESVTNPLRFPGQHADEISGLYYNHFRDYDPALGRYIQSDPIGLGGDLATYEYATSNPLMFFDRDGRIPLPLIAVIPALGGTINAVASMIAMAEDCDSGVALFKAFGFGFVEGATSTTVGLGVGLITRNPALAGSSGGLAGNLVRQTLLARDVEPISATVSTIVGGIGGPVADRLLPTRGFLPNLLKPRKLNKLGPNSKKLIGQEGVAGSIGALSAIANQGLDNKEACQCR